MTHLHTTPHKPPQTTPPSTQTPKTNDITKSLRKFSKGCGVVWLGGVVMGGGLVVVDVCRSLSPVCSCVVYLVDCVTCFFTSLCNVSFFRRLYLSSCCYMFANPPQHNPPTRHPLNKKYFKVLFYVGGWCVTVFVSLIRHLCSLSRYVVVRLCRC